MAKQQTLPADGPSGSKQDLFRGQGGSYRITEAGDVVRVEWTDPPEPKTKPPSED